MSNDWKRAVQREDEVLNRALAKLEESSAPDSVIDDHPPQDGREWDCQCARCGSTVSFERCETCGGEGLDGHNCGEDTCCCLHPEDNMTCDICGGEGSFGICISGAAWCEANPIPGRAEVPRGKIEWFALKNKTP